MILFGIDSILIMWKREPRFIGILESYVWTYYMFYFFVIKIDHDYISHPRGWL